MQKCLSLKAELPIEGWLGFFVGGKGGEENAVIEKTWFNLRSGRTQI